MEQRKGSSSQPLTSEPVTGAGFDPAFVPGLTAPATPAPESPDGEEAAAAAPRDTSPSASRAEEPPPRPHGGAEADAVGEEDPGESAEEAPGGPVFEAADRRARIVADRRGVRLSLDDQRCEFGWDEIGAVETETPRFGKRFTITVHTPDRRWYPIEIEAPSRSRFADWERELDAVLDAYFEEGQEPGAAEGQDPEDEAEARREPATPDGSEDD
ncbi:hypothetical protein [Streptomyces sp. NPDC046985]|uniref:hypothetical protein n=1 Tax=Streptomyces sp. NPDC046985 TaxID=3155377 RepID=UPI0033F3ECEC